MSLSKTSKQESAQQIDPMLRDEAIRNNNLIRALAAMGFNPYVGNTIAGFTDATQAAANMADSFASAFGFDGGAGADVSALRGTDDGSGISGFSPFEGMKAAMGKEYDTFEKQLNKWFKKASQNTPYQDQPSVSGGKK